MCKFWYLPQTVQVIRTSSTVCWPQKTKRHFVQTWFSMEFKTQNPEQTDSLLRESNTGQRFNHIEKNMHLIQQILFYSVKNITTSRNLYDIFTDRRVVHDEEKSSEFPFFCLLITLPTLQAEG